jgi:hypothetical protein
MNRIFVLQVLVVLATFLASPLHGQEQVPIQIKIQNAQIRGEVKVSVQNNTSQSIRIWRGMSWGGELDL